MSEYNPQRQPNILSSIRQPGLMSSIQPPGIMNMTGTNLHRSNKVPNQLQMSGSINPNLVVSIPRQQSINQNFQDAPVPIQQTAVEIQQPRNQALQNQFGFQSGYQKFVEDKFWKAIDSAVTRADDDDNTSKFKMIHLITIMLYLVFGVLFIYFSSIQNENVCMILKSWSKIFGVYCLVGCVLVGGGIASYIYLDKAEEIQAVKFWIQVVSYIEIGLLLYFTVILTVALDSPFDKNCGGLDNLCIFFLVISWISLIIFAGLYLLYKVKQLQQQQ